MYHLLFYDYVPDIAERRTPFRAEHLSAANRMLAEGKLLMAGAFADPLDGATFVFKATREEVEAFVESDPYVLNGLVTGHRIREWTVVVGGENA